MRALAYYGRNDVRVVDKPRPSVSEPTDAVIRVSVAAICGSDLHLYHALVPDTRVGHVLGHEAVGIVEEVGSAVRRLRPGDRVVVPFNIACGECFFCVRGLFSQCERTNPNSEMGGIYGYSHTTGGYDGAQAQYLRVPYADVGLRVVPPAIGDAKAVLLSDVLPTSYFGAENAQITPGDTVAVFGCGPIGLVAMRCLRQFFGAGRLIAIDRVPERLQAAREHCGAETIDFRETPDVVAALRELTDGRGPDASIDAVGLEAEGSGPQTLQRWLLLQAGSVTALNWALNATRGGGTVSVLGVYGPPFNHFLAFGMAMNRNITIRMGQCNVLIYLDDLMAKVATGELDPGFVLTHEAALEDVPEAYRMFAARQDGAIKVVVRP